MNGAFSSARHIPDVFLSELLNFDSGLQCGVFYVRVRATLMEILPLRSSHKDSNKYKAPHVSPQASSGPSCRYSADLYLFSLLSNGNLHQIWPRPPFAALRYRASPIWKHFVAPCRSVSWTRLCNPPLDSVQPNTALDFFVCASTSGFCGAHIGLLALSSTRFPSPTTSDCVRDELRDAWHA